MPGVTAKLETCFDGQLQTYKDYFDGSLDKVYIVNYPMSLRLKWKFFAPPCFDDLDRHIEFVKSPRKGEFEPGLQCRAGVRK